MLQPDQFSRACFKGLNPKVFLEYLKINVSKNSYSFKQLI